MSECLQHQSGKGFSQLGKWLVNSEVSSHITLEKELSTYYEEFDKLWKVGPGDGRKVDVIIVKNVHVNMFFSISNSKRCIIHKVL